MNDPEQITTLTRTQAIDLLRQKCAGLVGDEDSLCKVASERSILCRGFSQWTFTELKERFDWIVKKHPRITRDELEDLANRWQVARQFATDKNTACDVQLGETHHRICHGWDEFSEEDLARFCGELTGEKYCVVPDTSSAKET